MNDYYYIRGRVSEWTGVAIKGMRRGGEREWEGGSELSPCPCWTVSTINQLVNWSISYSIYVPAVGPHEVHLALLQAGRVRHDPVKFHGWIGVAGPVRQPHLHLVHAEVRVLVVLDCKADNSFQVLKGLRGYFSVPGRSPQSTNQSIGWRCKWRYLTSDRFVWHRFQFYPLGWLSQAKESEYALLKSEQQANCSQTYSVLQLTPFLAYIHKNGVENIFQTLLSS